MSNPLGGIILTADDTECYYEAVDLLALYLRQYATKELKYPEDKDRVSSRVKPVDDILEKVIRKKYDIQSKEDIFRYVDDIGGTRIVCDYLSEVEKVKNFVINCEKFLVLQMDDYTEARQCTGYRSCHCILAIDTLNYGQVKCELQIRTTAQHSWAEKSHPLIYKREKRDIPKLVCDTLVSLSDQLHNCDKLSDSVREFVEKDDIAGK